jgi:hypothetical protein
MIFGVSFSISVDEENLKWTKTSIPITLTRAIIGLFTTAGLEILILSFFKYHYPGGVLSKHSSIYVLSYVLPYVVVTFYAYGIYPVVAE